MQANRNMDRLYKSFFKEYIHVKDAMVYMR